jgi:hypothetical protein
MKPIDEARLLAARWLVDGGAGASACRLLGEMKGALANDVREASAAAALRSGVYAMVAHDDEGLVLPVRTHIGLPSTTSRDLHAGCMEALAATRKWFGVPSLPALRLDLEELLAVSGLSLGLPAALAFVLHFSAGSAPRRAVLATGRLDADGRVLGVGHVAAKLAAAAAETGERIVLVPRGQRASDAEIEVSSLSEAIAVALGDVRVPDARLMKLEVLIERARSETDPLAATAILEAIDLVSLPPADRGRVHLELGTVMRHAGRTEEAREHHALARELMITQRLVLGAETVERYELEVWLTAMDEFRVEDASAAISARLREPFMSVRNELRARGTLAQALGMQGRFAEAVTVRKGNLPLHVLSEDLARVLPGTLCWLVLDAARAGDIATFEEQAGPLVTATRPDDANQWRYTAHALVRSLVALGRHDVAIAWAEGRSSFGGVEAPSATIALLSGDAPIATHPETTLVRALARAYRRTGAHDRALALGRRVVPAPALDGGARANLVSWIARLVDFEVALCERDCGGDAAPLVAKVRTDLVLLHRPASGHYTRLFTCSMDALEAELDRVYY